MTARLSDVCSWDGLVPWFQGSFLIAGSLQVPTQGSPSLYVEPIKRALQIALMVEEKGEFAELPNGIMFKRGHVTQRYAKNYFNAFESLQVTVEVGDQNITIGYKLGLANMLRDIVLGLALIIFIFSLVPTSRGVLLVVLLSSLAYIGEFSILRYLEYRARIWLERVAQAPAAVTMNAEET